MSETLTIDRGGLDLLPEARPLWDALYDRHLEYGAAGLAVIERAESWPRRLAHYQHIFSTHSHATVFLARLDGEPVGYALGFEEEHRGEPAVVLETLSLLPAARGRGLGTRLMQMLDEEAKRYGATRGIVDVVTGNTPAFGFYRNVGFVPHSETWIRSTPTTQPVGDLPEDIADRAAEVGFEFATMPAPDDTWVSSEEMADLTVHDEVLDRETPPDAPALNELFRILEAGGLWTIQVTIPTAPASETWRETLTAVRFRAAMERLRRPIDGSPPQR